MLPTRKARRLIIGGAFSALGLISAIVGFGAAAKVSDQVNAKTAAAPAGPPRIALIIANADYPDSGQPLKGNVQHARHLAETLKGRGFEVELDENLSRSAMETAVERFVGKVKPGTTALFSFSGYGIQVAHQNYLVPTDARIWKESDVLREGSNLNALLDRLGDSGSATTIAIIDASRRNPFERRFRSVSAGLVSIAPKHATLALSTMGPGKTISDVSGEDRTLTTLADEMSGPQQDAETLFAHAKRHVSATTNGEQIPAVSSSLVEAFRF